MPNRIAIHVSSVTAISSFVPSAARLASRQLVGILSDMLPGAHVANFLELLHACSFARDDDKLTFGLPFADEVVIDGGCSSIFASGLTIGISPGASIVDRRSE